MAENKAVIVGAGTAHKPYCYRRSHERSIRYQGQVLPSVLKSIRQGQGSHRDFPRVLHSAFGYLLKFIVY